MLLELREAGMGGDVRWGRAWARFQPYGSDGAAAAIGVLGQERP